MLLFTDSTLFIRVPREQVKVVTAFSRLEIAAMACRIGSIMKRSTAHTNRTMQESPKQKRHAVMPCSQAGGITWPMNKDARLTIVESMAILSFSVFGMA